MGLVTRTSPSGSIHSTSPFARWRERQGFWCFWMWWDLQTYHDVTGLVHAHGLGAVQGGEVARPFGVDERRDRHDDADGRGHARFACSLGLEEALRRRREDRLEEEVGAQLRDGARVADEGGVLGCGLLAARGGGADAALSFALGLEVLLAERFRFAGEEVVGGLSPSGRRRASRTCRRRDPGS